MLPSLSLNLDYLKQVPTLPALYKIGDTEKMQRKLKIHIHLSKNIKVVRRNTHSSPPTNFFYNKCRLFSIAQFLHVMQIHYFLIQRVSKTMEQFNNLIIVYSYISLHVRYYSRISIILAYRNPALPSLLILNSCRLPTLGLKIFRFFPWFSRVPQSKLEANQSRSL